MPPQVKLSLLMPDNAALATLEGSEADVQYLAENALSVREGNKETIWQPARNIVTRQYYEGGQVVKKDVVQYKQTDGIFIPEIEWYEQQVIRPSGACMKSVVMRRYTNYTVQANVTSERNAPALEINPNELNSIITPNPVTDHALLLVGKETSPNAEVSLFDTAGKRLWSRYAVQPGQQLQIPLTEYAPGLYFVQVQSASGRQNIRIVKQ
jgi:hypothetical protein